MRKIQIRHGALNPHQRARLGYFLSNYGLAITETPADTSLFGFIDLSPVKDPIAQESLSQWVYGYLFALLK